MCGLRVTCYISRVTVIIHSIITAVLGVVSKEQAIRAHTRTHVRRFLIIIMVLLNS